MRPDVRRMGLGVKGFLHEEEGLELYRQAYAASHRGPCLEIGSYCGRSSIFLAEGCRRAGHHPLFTIDHHRGSEEQQPGEDYFDPELFDPELDRHDTLGPLVRNLQRAGLEDWALPMVVGSEALGRYWQPVNLALVFVDGSHSEESVRTDFSLWPPRLAPGGVLCVHDVFSHPDEGGMAPQHEVQALIATGSFESLGRVHSLEVLRCR